MFGPCSVDCQLMINKLMLCSISQISSFVVIRYYMMAVSSLFEKTLFSSLMNYKWPLSEQYGFHEKTFSSWKVSSVKSVALALRLPKGIIYPTSNPQFTLCFSQILVNCSEISNYDWYPSHLHIPLLCLLSPVGWGCRIHRLHLCRGVRLPQRNIQDMTLNNLMVRLQ